jgi:multidrug resistance efflux pump
MTDHLVADQADALTALLLLGWQLERTAAQEALETARAELKKATDELGILRERFDLAQRALGEARAHPQSPLTGSQVERRELVRHLDLVQRELDDARAQLKEVRGEAGPTALALAAKLSRLGRRFGGVKKVLKWVFLRRAG